MRPDYATGERITAVSISFLIFVSVLTVQHTEHFRIEAPAVVTIGTFDGVHLGHQKILRHLASVKEKTGLQTVVLTFDPHPRRVLFPEQKDLRLLTTADEKLELMARHGVDVAVVYPFSKQFAQLSSEEYIRDILVKSLHVQHLVIGYDHRFGCDRKGDISLLRAESGRYGFSVDEISAQDIDHIAISSSRIRKALEEGNLDLATQFLGHPFMLSGIVARGKQLGRTLGYPTANIEVQDEAKLIPPHGIYCVEVILEGLLFYGMMSIGINPTTDVDNKIKIEVHIFDFSAEIYGKRIQVNFIKRLRDEKKFGDLSELKQALAQDREACLALLSATS